ncbi:MAG: hypothetical protein IJR85_01555 [Synergistaceae bacterium]|nr:hypothetical protein [Synergistaceae bacterium]
MEAGTGHKGRKRPSEKLTTVDELLSAISDTEYPQYILEAIVKVQEWMHDMTAKPEEPLQDDGDIFASFFGDSFAEDSLGIESLFERLKSIEEFADVFPNPRMPDGKPDTLVISITPPDYDSGIRAAIDYAAVFNRDKCRRVWIISDTFIFDEVVKFVPHVDALAEQGIMLRYILVTPWGWVEMPLSGSAVSKHQFLWRTQEEKPGPTRRRRQD